MRGYGNENSPNARGSARDEVKAHADDPGGKKLPHPAFPDAAIMDGNIISSKEKVQSC